MENRPIPEQAGVSRRAVALASRRIIL
jgi:hypothetical protein